MKWLLMGILLGLTGCETAPPVSLSTGVIYARIPPLALSVQSISFSVEAPVTDLNLCSVSLLEMTQQWAKEALCKQGGCGILRVVVKELTVKEIPLYHEPSFSRWMKGGLSEKYQGRLSLSFEIWTPEGCCKNKVLLTISAEKYAMENYRMQERRALVLSLYEDIINRLTQEAFRILPELSNL